MADKSGRPSFNYGNKPVPMKLFATWEVDKTPPYCIPRLCTMRLSRIILLKPLGNDVSSILIAVKMQSSKRVLRSNEIMLYPNGLLDTDLDLTFSLQYPHFLKRDGNKLQVMLQRRKRYKNRTILGYKTLAIGTINMSQVLQKPVDLELELITGEGTSSGKSDGNTSLTGAPIAPAVLSSGQVCARISVVSLSSQPVDQDSSGVPGSTRRKTRMFGDAAGSAGERDGDFSDDEDDFSSNEEGSDSEPMADEARVPARQIPRKSSRAAKSGLVRTSERQRNLKQKFVALLKRFKVSEDFQNVFATGASGIDENLQREMDPEDIEDWMDEFDDLGAASCESGNEEDEEDTLSISSTPKPSLRPFFSSRSLLHESLSPPGVTGGAERVSDESSKKGDSDSHQDHNTTTDAEHSDPQPPSANPQPSTAAHLTAASSSSPPKASSGDEMRGESRETKREAGKETKSSSGFSDILYGAKTLFPKDWSGPGSSSKEKKSGGGKERDRTCSSSSTGGPCLFSFPDFNAQPRKVLVEQLGRILPSGSDESPPSSLLIVSTLDPQGALVASLLNASSSHRPAICTAGHADVKATINGLVNRIQRYCNSNAKSPNPVKVVLVGSDSHVNAAVKPFVEQLSSRPPDWLSYIRFLIVPLGLNNLSRYISSIDNGYSNLFGFDGGWRDLLEKEELIRKADGHEILSRISRYLDSCSGSLLLPIAEAMIAYKEKSSDEGSSQIFIPFISEVRIAFPEPASSASVDLDENSAVNASSGAGGTGNSPSGLGAAAGSASNLGAVSGSSGGTSSIPCASSPPGGTGGVSGSPPNQFGGSFLEARTRLVGDTTPPNSPNVAGNHPPTYSQEPLDLQIDYWLSPGSTRSSAGAIGDRGERGAIDRSTDGGRSGITLTRGDSVVSGSLMGGDGEKQSKGSGKCSLRASFRSLVIQRRPQLGETSAGHHFTMTYSLKEKKQKYVIQRLGKKKSEKEKEAECKSITVEGINRLVCMARAQNSPLKVTIDGIEWSGVKFFQLSSQWQTHVKHFPIATVAPFTYVLSDR